LKEKVVDGTQPYEPLPANARLYETMTGKKLAGSGDAGTASFNQFNKTDGMFGGGVSGNALNILLTADPNSPEYALAYRQTTMPVPTEVMQPDGSVKIVYQQPAPLPSSFPKPTYGGKPQLNAAGQPSVQQSALGVGQPPVNQGGGQVKSTPYAPTPEQINKSRQQILVIDKLTSGVQRLEDDIRTNGMQVGGFGASGGRQEGLFQDSILQLKELQNLGVLNGPDEKILLKQLADPTQISSWLRSFGPEYVLSKITELQKKAKLERDLINNQYPQPISSPSAPSALPSKATPSDIDAILRKYPSRK